MPNTLRGWSATLGNSPLPAMTPSLERITELLDCPNTTNSDLQQIIDLDPGFALAIFRSFTTASKTDVEPPHTLSHAISLLGLASVGRIMHGLTILLGSKHVANEGLIHCYSRALHAAHYARKWGRQRNDINPEEMGLAAMFYSCGEMTLWTHAEDKMREIETLVAKGADHNSAAIAVLGCSLSLLSLALARQWRLPPLTLTALESCWPLQTRTLEVILAVTLARASEQSWYATLCQDVTTELAQLHGGSADQVTTSLHMLAVDAAREMAALPLPLTATQFVAPFRASAITASNALQKIFALTMTKLHNELGLRRIMFAILSSDRKELKARFVIGAAKDDPIRQLSIPLDKNSLFAIMLRKPQGVWLNATTSEKYLPIIPNSVHASIDTRGFIAISLFVRNKPIGILYADSANPDTMSNQQFDRFKQLGSQLSLQLSRAE